MKYITKFVITVTILVVGGIQALPFMFKVSERPKNGYIATNKYDKLVQDLKEKSKLDMSSILTSNNKGGDFYENSIIKEINKPKDKEKETNSVKETSNLKSK